MKVAAGTPLIELLELAYASNQPVLLSGRHGVGKSQLVAAAAGYLGIAHIVRDLSLMEPPDLAGLPVVEDGRMRYATPSFLPREGRGLLVFEELNRAPRHLQAPCLQLLTARCLNDYHLPAGWLPVACINPARSTYQTHELDPALRSRFLQVEVEPDHREWLSWARNHEIDERVVAYVSSSPDMLKSDEGNPRAWTYASNLLHQQPDPDDASQLLMTALTGLLGETLGTGFYRFLCDNHRPLTFTQVATEYPRWRSTLLRWREDGRLDLLRASLEAVLQQFREGVKGGTFGNELNQVKDNLRTFAHDMPADLRQEATDCLHSCRDLRRGRPARQAS